MITLTELIQFTSLLISVAGLFYLIGKDNHAGMLIFVQHENTPFFSPPERWSARRGQADRWRSDPPPTASQSPRRCDPGRAIQ